MSRRKRHELEVTADRLGDHYSKYYTLLDPDELKAISTLRMAFDDIAEGGRNDREERRK